MGDDEAEGVEEIARAVTAGEDAIAVPGVLLADTPPGQTPGLGAPTDSRSLYAEILRMTVGEKVKLALRGNHDARQILLRDGNRVIRRLILQNPRISDGEVAAIAGNRSTDDDVLRSIADKREWVQKYEIRRALAVNPKTPIVVAIKFIATLLERDLRLIARSKNVPEAVAAQARRLLSVREKSR